MSWTPQIVTSQNASAMIGSPIFDAAGDAVGEGDRHLDHAQTGAHDPVGHLDLEPVPARLHTVEPDGPQRVGPVDAEPGGGVVDGETQHDRDVAVAPARQPGAPAGPSGHRATRDVPRSDHERDAAIGEVEHHRQHRRVVGEIGVELHHGVVLLVERRCRTRAGRRRRDRAWRRARRGAGRGRRRRVRCTIRRVSSDDASSTTSTSVVGRTARKSLIRRPMLSASLWVGTTTSGRITESPRTPRTTR